MATRRELLEAAMISGDEVLTRFGEQQLGQANKSRKASIGRGFILDSATGEITRDPGYAGYEQERDALAAEQRRQLQESMLERLGVAGDIRTRQPRYTAQETEGGIAPVQINPQARGGARAEPTIPVDRPISDSAKQDAAEAERLAQEAIDLYAELERVEGTVSSPKDIVASVIGGVSPSMKQAAQGGMFTGEQRAVKARGARFESDLSKLAAGLALTGFEIGERMNWSPFAPGISQEDAQRRLETIQRNFAGRGSTIRGANRPRNPDGLSRNEWLESGPDDGAYKEPLAKPKRVKVDAQGNVIGN